MLNVSLVFILTTILFGFFLFIIIRRYSITGMVQLCISWLLGSMITAFIIWILTLFFSLSKNLIFAVILFQVIFCFIVIIVFRDKPDQLNVNFEKHYKLFLILLVTSIVSLGYLNSVYCNFPISFPSSASEIFDIEMSFISSFRHGINKYPRFYDALSFIQKCKMHTNLINDKSTKINSQYHKVEFNDFIFNSDKNYFKNAKNPFYYYFRPLFFSDPIRNGKTFIWPTLPLIYLAALNEVGLSYSEASLIVCFLNTISTVVGIFFLSFFFLAKIDICVVILFLFSSGNSFFYFFTQNGNNKLEYNLFSKYDDFDLIHDFGKERKSPFYSPILNLLSFSKHTSFAIPLALFTLAFAHPLIVKLPTTYILAGIFLLLNPSPAVSLSLIIALLFYSNSIKYILPFTLSILPKLIIFNDNFNIDNNFLNIIENNTIYFNENNLVGYHSNRFSEAISFLIRYKPIWKEYQIQGIFYSPFWAYFDFFGILFFFLLISPLILYLIDLPIFTQRFIASFSSFIIFSLIRVGNDYYENCAAIISVFLPFLVFICIRSFDKFDSSIDCSSDDYKIYHSGINENKNSFLKLFLNFFTNGQNSKSKQIKGVMISLKYIISIIFILGTLCSAHFVSGFSISQLNPITFYSMYFNNYNNNKHNNSNNEIYSVSLEDFRYKDNLESSAHLFRTRYDDFAFANYLHKSLIHPRIPIFCNAKLFNPISALAGRPIFTGNFHELWKRGADISEELQVVKLINKTKDRFTIMKDLGYKYLYELKEDPFIVINSSIINFFNVLYTDEKYIFLEIRDD